MSLSLRIITSESGDTTDLELGDTTTIGRSSLNRVQIQQGYISSKHAVITKDESGNYSVSDLGSKNGTFVNDTPVESPTDLNDGDVLRFGLAACQVVAATEEATSASESALIGAPRQVRMVVKSSRKGRYAYSRELIGRREDRLKSGKKRPYLASSLPEKGRFGKKFYSPFAQSKVG